MAKYAIITPTILGREKYLERCIASIKYQMFDDYKHYICGDGFMPSLDEPNVIVCCTDKICGFWGNECRNKILRDYCGLDDYLLFVDDDNVLLPTCLNKLSRYSEDIIISKMLRNDIFDPQISYPGSFSNLEMGQIGSLNFCIRSSIARGLLWKHDIYEADFYYFQECRNRCRANGGESIAYIDEYLSVWCTNGA